MSDFDRNECLKAMKELIGQIKDTVTGTIYHYTNIEGFKGIIESKEIWMTNALFVNDKTELRSSFGGNRFKDIQFENPELFDVFKKGWQQYKSKDIESYYLASFSKKGNSLDQFRAYGNYCIGFDAKNLVKNIFNLFVCIYKENDIKEWIVSKDGLAEWKNTCFNNEQGKPYMRSAFFYVDFAGHTKFKNAHYKSEEEVRLLAVSNSSWGSYTESPEMFCQQPAIYFRNHSLFDAPVPYVKFFIPKKSKTVEGLNKMVKGKSQIETKQIIREMESEQERALLPINEVGIGPMQHQEEAACAAKIFLSENGYDEAKVTLSDIPFRGK